MKKKRDQDQRNQNQVISGLPQTPTAWMAEWLGLHYPDNGAWPVRVSVRDEMFDDLPQRLVPSLDGLVRKWWNPTFQRGMRDLGRRPYRPEEEGPELLVVELQLPLDGLLSILTGDLVRARQDVLSVKKRIAAWAEVHPGAAIDVEAVFAELCEAAGL